MRVGRAEIHVWCIDLDAPQLDACADALNAVERERAGRFHSASLSHDFRRCRGSLRHLLAFYEGTRAQDIRFEYGRFGKPELPGSGLHFNVSHSGRHALVAIADAPLGVDLEYMEDKSIGLDELGKLVYHPSERSASARLGEEEKRHFFYRTWSRKESYTKALGLGLQASLSHLSFDACPSAPAARVQDESRSTPAPYFVHHLPLDAAYSASVCVQHPYPSIELRCWHGS